MNTIDGRVVRVNESLVVELPGGRAPLTPQLARAVEAAGLEEVVLGVRPEDLRLANEGGVAATVAVVEALGHECHVACRLPDGQLVIVRQRAEADLPAPEENVRLIALPEVLHVFDPESGNRIDAA
jgi:multiple sugar transport system ATP-binding protein